MPIQLDHEKSSNGVYGAVYLEKPIIGKNELDFDQQAFSARGYQTDAIWPNVDMTSDGYRILYNDSGFVREAHAYLSETTTHPWFISESFSNNYHSTNIGFFIENHAERKNFLAEFGTAFEERDNTFDIGLWGLAVLKGVMPPVSANEDPALWLHLNCGYEMTRKDGERIFRLEYKELEEDIVSEWVGEGKLLTAKEDGSYVCDDEEYAEAVEEKGFGDFLNTLSRYRFESALYPLKARFRCKKLEAAFVQTWGDICLYDDENECHLISPEARRGPKYRKVPQVLTDYLDGKAPDPTPPGFVLPQPMKPLFAV